MTRIPLDFQITDLLKFYRTEHNIYGRCPHCGEAFRLSEVKLTYGKEPPRDVLARLKRDTEKLADANSCLQDQLDDIEGDHVTAINNLEGRWRERVGVEVERKMVKEKRELRRNAIAQSRRTMLGKVIERVAPWFSGSGHHPGDVRPIFDPLDFVVFDGLYSGEVREVVFIEFKTGDSRLTGIQRSIRDAISKKRVHFKEQRMSKVTMERLAGGKMLDPGASALETRPEGAGR